MSKLQFDISSDNFMYFFEKEAALMTEAQKELLPKELLFRLYAKGGRVNVKETAKMSFLAKLFVLFKALKKRVIIIVEDDGNGMDEEEYFKWKKLTAKQNYSQDNAGKLITEAQFVLGNKELCDTYHRLNGLSGSPAYTYLCNAKNKDYTKPKKWLEGMEGLIRFLSNYEANRKNIAMKTGLTMSDWLVLIYLYHGNLVPSAPIYNSWYKYSFNSSARKIRGSFSVLQTRSYVEKVGSTNKAKLRITALGKDKVNEICKNYITNA